MRSVLVVALMLGGCGGDGERPAATADDADKSDPPAQGAKQSGDGAAEDPTSPIGLPTKCAREDGEVCLPPHKFVNALCNADYPTVALSLFANGTPWTHAYMLAEVKAVYASGGASSNEILRIDEEVVVLRKRSADLPGGMQVSGAGASYDVLMWDGACATVDAGQLGFQAPAKVKNARIIWSNLELAAREKLKENAAVYEAYVRHKKTCKGVTFGDVSKECVKADEDLSRAVAEAVRSQGGLPPPNKLPELY